MATANRLLRGAVLKTISLAVQVGVGFVMMPFLVSHLGEREYGFWAVAGDTLAYYSLLDLGLSSAVSRFVSRSVGCRDRAEMSEAASSAFVVFCALGAVAAIASLVIAGTWEGLFPDAAEMANYRYVIVILGVGLGAGFPVRAHSGVLGAMLRYDLAALATTVRSLLVLVGAWAALTRGGGVVELALITVCGQFVEYALIVVFARRAAPDVLVSWSRFSRPMLRPLFSFGSRTFLAQIADLFRYRVDSLVIASSINLIAVTPYVVGARLVDYMNQVVGNVLGLAMPVFSRLEGEGDFEGIRAHLKTLMRVSTVISTFIGGSVLTFSAPLVEAWMGHGFDTSVTVLTILCVPQILALAQLPAVTALYGISKHHYYMWSNLLEGIFNLALTLLLVRPFGIVGVALGTALPMTIVKATVQPVLVCRVLGISAWDFYGRYLLWNFGKAGAPIAVFYVLFAGRIAPTLSSLAMWSGLFSLFYMVYAWRWLAGSAERQLLRDEGRNLLRVGRSRVG